jgi:hypothetical protein
LERSIIDLLMELRDARMDSDFEGLGLELVDPVSDVGR